MALTSRQTRTPLSTDPIRSARKFHGVYSGVVRDNKDVQRMGRLRVWVDVLGADFDDERGWVTATYCSPFAGATDYDRVNDTGAPGEHRIENAQTSYGFWMVPPDINNTVLIMFINGDPSRAVWIGCLFQQKTQRMVPGIPHGNTFDEGETPTQERRPVGEHNRQTDKDHRESMQRPEMHDSEQDGISRGLKDQGLIRDYVRGMTDSGARRETPSEVYGILTPGPRRDDITASAERSNTRKGGSQFVMDDGEGREKIRIRTRSGAQILLDESNGLVYITNRDGTAWVHMDERGRIDIYGAENMSIRSERDFTLRADRDIIFEAGRDISLKANRDWEDKQKPGVEDSDNGALKDKEAIQAEGGNIRVHANQHLDMIASNDHRVTINGDMYLQVGNDRNAIIGRDDNTQVDRNAYLTVNQEDYRIAVNRDYLNTAGGNSEQFAGNDMKLQAVNDIEQFAFRGKMDIGSHLNMSLKTKRGDFSAVAEAAKGNMSLVSNNSANQLVMSNPFSRWFSMGNMITQSKKGVSTQVNDEFEVDDQGRIRKGNLLIDGQCLRFDGGVNIEFGTKEIKMDATRNIAQRAVDAVGNPISTSLETINRNFDNLEARFNELSYTTVSKIAELAGAISGSSSVPNLTGFINGLPTFPSLPQLPSFAFPAIRLPNFPFDFCVEVGQLISIDQYNPFPNGLFGTVGLDLGGWTRSNIGGWFGRQRANFGRMTGSMNIGAQLRTQARDAVRQVRGNVTQIRRSLSSLVSVSAVLSSNGDYLRDYSIGIRGFEQNLDRYRSTIVGIPGADDGLAELQDQMGAHARTMEQLVKLADQDPGAIEGFDYSELAEMAQFMRNLELDLIEIGEEQPGIV